MSENDEKNGPTATIEALSTPDTSPTSPKSFPATQKPSAPPVPKQPGKPSGAWYGILTLFRPGKQIGLTWLGSLGAVTFFVLTALYAITATLGAGASWSHGSHGRALLLLRLLSEGTSLCLVATIASSLERLQWMLVSSNKGLDLPSLLGLNAGTGVLGMLALVFTRSFKWPTRLWSSIRLLLKAIVPAMAVLIMSDITTERVPVIQSTFPVAAGIGPFEPSFADDYSLISGIYFATDLTNFLSNPQRVVSIEPVKRPVTPCTLIESQKRSKACSASYFMPGGLELATPWPSKIEDDWSSEEIVITNLQGYQLDFSQTLADVRFNGASDCRVLGDSDAAIQICITSTENILSARFVHCPLEIASSSACTLNKSWQVSSGWSTSLQAYRRQATMSFSRTNTSILSIEHSSLSAPEPANISAQGLLSVFAASFNSSNPGSGSATQFIQYLGTLLIFAETSSVSYNAAASYLRNLLALPLYYFHANNLSPTIAPSPDRPLPGLPIELYTTASLARTSYRIVVGRATVIGYIVVGSLLLLTCLGTLLVGSLNVTAGRCPETTVWSTLDFVANCEIEDANGSNGERSLAQSLKDCRGLSSGRKLNEKIKLSVVLDRGDEGGKTQA